MPGYPVPPEARLEALLREAFEFMPGPDMARLAEIESRLLRTAKRPVPRRRVMLPWWALLLLAGGAATAAWWVVDRTGEQDRPVLRSNSEPSAAPGLPADGAREASGAPSRQSDSRIIYERETH